MKVIYEAVLGWAGIIVLLVAWQLATHIWTIPKWLLPSPVDVAVAFWAYKADLLRHVAVTLFETTAGFCLAVLIAVPLGMALVSSSIVWRVVYPVVTGIQTIPKTALAPLLLVWLGAGYLPQIVIAFLVSFFPIVVNTVMGMTAIEQDLLDVLRSVRASRWEIIRRIRLPSALPYIFGACKIAVTLAIIGAVIGEFVGSDAGLGYMILAASSQLKTDLAFVSILILSALGMVLFWSVSALERVFVPWAAPTRDIAPQI
jgi:NitT/TauT family transport system permease protein